MRKVNELFRYGHHEAIVTSVNDDGEVNVAPMGVDLQNKNLILRPYINTKTYRNIRQVKEAVINLTNDALLFYDTLFNKQNLKFVSSKKVKPPRVNGYVDYYVECIVKRIKVDRKKLRATVVLKPVYIEKGQGSVLAYSRPNSFIIEMLIYFTKIEAFTRLGKVNEAYEALEHVINYYVKVTRLGSPKAIEVARNILSKSFKEFLDPP